MTRQKKYAEILDCCHKAVHMSYLFLFSNYFFFRSRREANLYQSFSYLEVEMSSLTAHLVQRVGLHGQTTHDHPAVVIVTPPGSRLPVVGQHDVLAMVCVERQGILSTQTKTSINSTSMSIKKQKQKQKPANIISHES
jgi:hypothetical protein